MPPLTIRYRKEFFGESTQVLSSSTAKAGMPRGLVGRQVANAEMLSALLRNGTDPQFQFLVESDRDAQSLRDLLNSQLPSDKKAVITPKSTWDAWMANPGRRILWEPQPPTASLAWTRQRLAPRNVALAGVTHALCSATAVAAIRDLVFSPTKNHDRLVCTSEAVAHTARTLIRHYCGLLGKHENADMIQLETIPLGVDCQRHRPATEQERSDVRNRLGIKPAEDVVLFVGRLSHHAKSNPLPMYAACHRASRRTGRKVVLILAGWFASDAIKTAFETEARRIAPHVRLIHVDAMDPQWRDSVWAAADIFVSLADSVQETFGLTVVEAMSRRIPVIASDWNGYRESIEHDRTGLLVPTTMLEGAGEQALLRMHEGNLSYDHFLAAIGQTVNVSNTDAGEMLESLLSSPAKRRSIAEAAHRHARATFDWTKIIPRYERLWKEQISLMQLDPLAGPGQLARTVNRSSSSPIVPSLRDLFDRYPTTWIRPHETLESGVGSLGDFEAICDSNLAGHADGFRFDRSTAGRLLQRCTAADSGLESLQNIQSDPQGLESDNDDSRAADTVAWLIKFDLLRPTPRDGIEAQNQSVDWHRVDVLSRPAITFTTTCMGRLDHLRHTLPQMVRQRGCHVVVVDYSCPDGAGKWIRENFSSDQVTVVSLPGRKFFDRSEAKNAAILAAKTPWICVIDADIVVADDFADQIRYRLGPNRFLRRLLLTGGVGGTFVAWRPTVLEVGMHDPVFQDWGEEDFDLMDALRFAGHQASSFPEELISHLDHENDRRMQFHQAQDHRISHLTNRIYRAAKWDLTRLAGDMPRLKTRKELYASVRKQIVQAVAARSTASIVLPVGSSYWDQLSATGSRVLTYQIEIDDGF